MRNKKDEKRFEASENVGLQQFHILGAAGCIGNTLGFLGNVIIYGWTVPWLILSCGLRACYVGCDDLGICQQACTSSILYHHCDGGTDGVPYVVLCI